MKYFPISEGETWIDGNNNQWFVMYRDLHGRWKCKCIEHKDPKKIGMISFFDISGENLHKVSFCNDNLINRKDS